MDQGIESYLVQNETDANENAALVTLVREPLMRLVATYRERLETTSGQQKYYSSILANILASKYPNAAMPLNGTQFIR